MKFLDKIKSLWINRKAKIRRARIRALEAGETVLSIVADAAGLTNQVLDAMLSVEAVFGGALKGNQKAQKVIEMLKRADETVAHIEKFILRAIAEMHDELNDDGKIGWEKL